MQNYNYAVIRELVEAAFDDEDLIIFCSDHFSDVAEKRFAQGQAKQAKVHSLIDHVKRQGLTDKLLNEIRKANPYQYERFEQGIERFEHGIKEDKKVGKQESHIINSITEYLTLNEELIDISQQISYNIFDFIGYKETKGAFQLLAFVKADNLTQKEITNVCDKYLEITKSYPRDQNIKLYGRNPNGLICFVFQNGCQQSLIKFVQKQNRISHGGGGLVVSWVIDLKESQIHTHKNPVSHFPPVIILPETIFPGVKYFKGILSGKRE